MRLLDVKQGKIVKIVKFGSTLAYKRRLVEMGIKVGSVIKVLTRGSGSVIIDISGARYILGSDLVKYIEVEDD